MDMTMTAIDAVSGRHSIRNFLPNPVTREQIEGILQAAARAPSGTNSQPWKVHVVTGEVKERLSAAVIDAAKNGRNSNEYPYSPKPWWEPYVTRRRKVGFDLYALYGVERDDMDGRMRAGLRNFEFFGAPVGLFFSMEKELLYGSWLDVGMFMQNVMTVARAYGLETCPQQAWCEYADAVREVLNIDEGDVLISGMSLGYANWDAKENSLVTERAPVQDFTRFYED